MIKKTISFETLDGDEVTEDFYFHLNKTELLSLQVEDKRGLEAVMQAIVDAEDTKSAFDWIKKVVLLSVGERSIDGKRFIKNQDIVDNFSQTAAMDELVFELLSAPDQAAEFFKSLMPASMQKEQAEAEEKVETLETELSKPEEPKKDKKKSKKPQEMTREELLEAFAERNQAAQG